MKNVWEYKVADLPHHIQPAYRHTLENHPRRIRSPQLYETNRSVPIYAIIINRGGEMGVMIFIYILMITVMLVLLYDLIQEAKHPPPPMSDEEIEFLLWMDDEELMEEELGNYHH